MSLIGQMTLPPPDFRRWTQHYDTGDFALMAIDMHAARAATGHDLISAIFRRQ